MSAEDNTETNNSEGQDLPEKTIDTMSTDEIDALSDEEKGKLLQEYTESQEGKLETIQKQTEKNTGYIEDASEAIDFSEVPSEEEIYANLNVDASEAVDFSETPDGYIKQMGEKAKKKNGNDKGEVIEKELQERYESSKVSKETFESSIDAYLIIEGVDRGIADEETEKSLSDKFNEASGEKSVEEINNIILSEVESKINKLFGVEGKNLNEEKRQALIEETENYLKLLKQAQADGSLPEGLTSKDVYSLLEQNLYIIAYQDRKASETSIGDHGVRHIIHNIKQCDNLFNQLNTNNPGSVSAMDKLITHQAMIMHDMGYATDEVAGKDFSKDFGHNVLSAKIAMENIIDTDSPIGRVFSSSPENGELIYSAILNHDSSKVEFDMSKTPTPEGRKNNIESAVHLADNLHAFETKLPELLYAYPKTLEALTLLKEANETLIQKPADRELTDEEIAFNQKVLKTIYGITSELQNRIRNDTNISLDDTEALLKAVDSLEANTGNFVVGRLLGKDAITTINPDGKIEISVAESVIHQESVKLFGVKDYEQFRKFIGDVSGNKLSDDQINAVMQSGKFETFGPPPFVISIRRQEMAKPGEIKKSDLDEKMEPLLKNPDFNNHTAFMRRKKVELGKSKRESTKQHKREAMLESLSYYMDGEK